MSLSFRKRDKLVIEMNFGFFDKEPMQYPSEWFHSHPGSKPSVNVMRLNTSINDLAKIIHADIRRLGLKLPFVKLYLYMFFKTKIVVNDAEWKSFGVQLGAVGEALTPWSLITIREVEVDETLPEVASNEGRAQPLEALAFYLLCIHHLIRITNENSSKGVIVKMQKHLRRLGSDLTLDGAANNYKSWERDADYNKMVCAIDMFYYKFKNEPEAYIRICTIRSRYTNCSILKNLLFIIDFLKCTITEFVDWVFLPDIESDFRRILKPGEEVLDEHSYFPYQVELGLTTRSPYSSTLNQCLYHLIHIVGILLENEESKNKAFYLDICLPVKNLLNELAVYMAYAFRSIVDPEKVGYDKVVNEKSPTFEEKLIKQFIKRQQDKINNPKVKSIGEYVKMSYYLERLSERKNRSFHVYRKPSIDIKKLKEIIEKENWENNIKKLHKSMDWKI